MPEPLDVLKNKFPQRAHESSAPPTTFLVDRLVDHNNKVFTHDCLLDDIYSFCSKVCPVFFGRVVFNTGL